jgi:thioredoxin 1
MAVTHPVVVTNTDFAQEIEGHDGLAMVDFWATWCGPCQIIAPVVVQLAQEYEGRLKVAKLDVDANQETAVRFNVRSIPSVLFFKGGQHVDTVVGAVPKAYLVEKIEQHLG